MEKKMNLLKHVCSWFNRPLSTIPLLISEKNIHKWSLAFKNTSAFYVRHFVCDCFSVLLHFLNSARKWHAY